jgi:ABC-type dipeptide/oligopeptide/nickel transport system permease subunit
MLARRIARRLLAHRGAAVGAILAVALVAIAAVGPAITSHDPEAVDVDHGLSTRGAPRSPSAGEALGTDQLGRDVWARVVAAAPATLGIALAATALALAFGFAVGLAAGLAGRWVDGALMRLVELVLAFPYLLLAILLAALLHGTSLASSGLPVVLALAAVGWPLVARVTRGKAMAIARCDYVHAARALGATPLRVSLRHVLPNLTGVAIAIGVPVLADTLLAESTLNWLGLGPTPSWGRMMYEGREYYRVAPWLMLAPGLAIVGAVVALHLIGDAVRDALDPKGDHA